MDKATTLVKLKNGSEEALIIVNLTTNKLLQMQQEGIFGLTRLYDLVEICKNTNYVKQVSEKNLKALQDVGLLQNDGFPHDSVKNVVLSSVEGKLLGMKIVSPIAE